MLQIKGYEKGFKNKSFEPNFQTISKENIWKRVKPYFKKPILVLKRVE
jgi:hypothetical protein